MICLDANVLLELLLERKNVVGVRSYLDLIQDDLAITMMSLNLVMCFAELNHLDLHDVEAFLRLFIWLPLVEADSQWGFEHYQGDDFEDALQIACALREGCDRFATLDRRLANKYEAVLSIDLLLPDTDKSDSILKLC